MFSLLRTDKEYEVCEQSFYNQISSLLSDGIGESFRIVFTGGESLEDALESSDWTITGDTDQKGGGDWSWKKVVTQIEKTEFL
jgi:hypothetical protein